MKIDRICRKFLFWDEFLKIAYREIKDLRYQENSQTEICDRSAWIDNFEDTYLPFKKLETAVQEFRTYIERNGRFIPNYGERWRYGEAIATGIVESTVNQVVSKRFYKRQQMQWTKRGAHLLLQTRVKTLNQELAATFKRWYPDMQLEEEAVKAA